MKAAYISSGQFLIQDRPRPKIEPEEVLVKTCLVGICQTDIELFSGYYNFEGIPGHEFVGIVEQSPTNPELIGERIVADINCGCNQCSHCLQGDPRHCPQRTVIGICGHDGALAEYVKVPLKNIHIIPQTIPDQEAVFAEPLAAALEISQQIHISNSDRLAILGDGKLGLLIALGLKYYCPGLVLFGKHTDNLKIAQAQGIETRLLQSDNSEPYALEIDKNFNIVVEATGSTKGLNLALEITRAEGTIVCKTTSHHPTQLNFAPIVVKEISILGSRCGDLSLALSFLKNKWIDVRPLIDSIFPFYDCPEAFSHAQKPGTKKVLISMADKPA